MIKTSTYANGEISEFNYKGDASDICILNRDPLI